MLCSSLPDISMLGHVSHLLCYTCHNVPAARASLPSFQSHSQHSSQSVCEIGTCSKLSISKNPNLSVTCPLPTSPITSNYPLHSRHNGLSLLKVTRHVQASGPLHLFLFLPQVVMRPGSLPSLQVSTQKSLPFRPSDHPTFPASHKQ